jgi:hypothetical protein
MQAEVGVTVVFGGKAVLTWCRIRNAVSRECLGDEGREPPGPAITDSNGEAMISIGWGRRVACRRRRCCCCLLLCGEGLGRRNDSSMQRVEAGLKPQPIFWYRHFARKKPQEKGLNKDYSNKSVVKWT